MPIEFHDNPDEVADPAYFTVAEARAIKPLDDMSKYPDEAIDAMREAVEESLEHECGIAFVPRDEEWTTDGNGRGDIVLPFPRPISVTACTVGGTALTTDQIAALVLYRDGRVYNPLGWTAGRGNVVITFQHGWLTIPGRVKRFAIQLTKRFLVDTPISDRTTSIVDGDGARQSFITAGVRDAIYDLPEGNLIVQSYGLNSGVA